MITYLLQLHQHIQQLNFVLSVLQSVDDVDVA